MKEHFPVYSEGGPCRDCYKCIRLCPVKAIQVENEQTDVLSEMCLSCGRCVLSCPRFYKKVRKDIGKVELLLSQKKKVFVSLDPSFAAEFTDCSAEQLIASLKRLGFYAVSETALGADILSAETAKLMRDALDGKTERNIFISSACPATVKYIKLFNKNFAPYISEFASPLLLHARLLRKLYGENIGVVSVSACYAKKLEADAFPEIDAAITFSELRQWFLYEGIVPKLIEPDGSFVPRRAAKGALFPLAPGQITAFKKYAKLEGIMAIASSGILNIKKLLDNFDMKELDKPLFLSLFVCSGGCLNGPGMSGTVSGITRRIKLYDYAEKSDDVLDADTLSVQIKTKDMLSFPAVIKRQFTKEDTRAALASIGKYKKADEINCGSCGYDTCRDFVGAMLAKFAEKTMCVTFMRNMARRQANGLLRAIPSGVVIVDKELNIIECNRNFARLMGPDIEELYDTMPGLEGAKLNRIMGAYQHFSEILSSDDTRHREYEIHENKKIFHLNVFLIEKHQIAAGVIEDITTPQMQKEKTLRNAREIIDKNIAAVQQIAFLLGENAAETEALLHSMMQAYEQDDE